MNSAKWLFFGPYRFDRQSGALWRDEEQIPLRARTYSLLQYLAEHPGDVLSIAELQRHAWQGDHVSPSVFRVSIHELRHALQDDPDVPQYIETVRGKGYRFCASVTASGGGDAQPQDTPTIIGRAHELSQLQDRLTLAQHGQRQIVFVSGEAGMGKTTLIEAFLDALSHNLALPIGRGNCIEHHGPAEAYLPVLQALSHLGLGPFRAALVQALQQDAPTWLRQLPRLMTEAQREQASADIPASTRVRMIRELVDALDILSADQPLVLVLEDLHWSDPSTIDLLNAVMQRVQPARLLMLCTYRPLEVQVRDHPLSVLLQEWQGRGQGLDLRLAPLTTDAIQAFLGRHLPGIINQNLADILHKRSDGNPLFLSRLFDYLRQHELLIDIDGQWQLIDEKVVGQALPDGVRQLLNKQIDQLPEMVQEVLQTASVAGVQFTTAMVAAGAETETRLIDETLSWAATRSYFLQAQATEMWPDGTISGGYRFEHALYRQVLYDRLSAEWRVKLHRLMGERLERAYIDDLDPVAGLLAYHFAEGQDSPRALSYLHRASLRALRRFAANEAIALLNTALALIPALPPARQRDETEYHLQTTLGTAMIAAQGARVPEAHAAYERAYRLGVTLGDVEQMFPPLVGMETITCVQADFIQSQHLCGHLFNYAQISRDPLHLAYAYCALSVNHAMQGHFLVAHDYAQACQRLPLPPDRWQHDSFYSVDPVIFCQRWHAVILVELGYPEQGLAMSRAVLAKGRQLGDPVSVTQGLLSALQVSMFCVLPNATLEVAQALVAHAQYYGQTIWEQVGHMFSLWALAKLGEDEGTDFVARLKAVQASYLEIGVLSGYLLGMCYAADTCYYAGQIEDGLAFLQDVEDAIDDSGERLSEAPLYLYRGKLLHSQGDAAQAEACLVHALTLARQRGAKGTELRVAMALSRLWQAEGEQERAWQLLWPIYQRFTEGFDTAELQEARELLAALAP